MKLHKLSLFGAVVGALIFMAALAPRANAAPQLIEYYNFEDSTVNGAPDFTSTGDLGLQHATMGTNYSAGDMKSVVWPGAALNRAAGDPDVPPAGTPSGQNLALNLNSSAKNEADGTNQFTIAVDATLIEGMSLSFAQNSGGNGFAFVTFDYSIDGGTTFNANLDAQTAAMLTGGNFIVSFDVPAGANDQTDLVLRLTFTGGQSNGNNDQTIIDNVQVNGTVVPEPTTVMGGLLGVCGLCWHQRRRLIYLLRLRRA